MQPYKDIYEDDIWKIRYFDRQGFGNPNVWHKDEEDREIFLLWSFGKCLIQLDNELPVEIPKEKFFIPKETYHRLIIPDIDGKLIIGIVETFEMNEVYDHDVKLGKMFMNDDIYGEINE